MDYRRRGPSGQEVRSLARASARHSSAFKRRTALWFWCGVFFFSAFLAAACSISGPDSAAATNTELTVGVPEATVAGADLGVEQFANLLSLEGLTNVGVEGRALPRLAERWEWERNGLRLRIHLRPGITFHDGTPFSSSVAAEVVQRAVTRPANLALYPALSDIASVTPEGDLQLVLDLSQPSALLPEDLTVPLGVGQQGVGTGPYRVVTKEPSELVLERFERHYLGTPAINRVVVRPFPTLRTAWTSLLRGEVDVVSDVPADAVEFIRNDDVQVVSFERWYQYLIGFNSQNAPFRSPVVRRALNLAIDRRAVISNVLEGRGAPSTGPLWPKYWAYDASVVPYSFDPGLAASLLDSAGFRATNSDDAPGKPPARLRFTCLVPADFSVWERIALEVQKHLFNIGVDMQFRVVPVDEYNRLIRDREFEAALIDMISGPTPGRAYIFWRSGRQFKGLNLFGYENAEAERLFDVLRTSTNNEAAVRSATRRLQRVFLDDPPALFLAWNERARAIRRDFAIPEEPGRDPMLTLGRWTSGPVIRTSSGQ